MNIGVDVDGVLTNLEDYILEKGKKYFGDKYKVIDETAYDVTGMFGCTVEEREKFWTKYIWEYCLKTPIANHASEVLNKLKVEGNKIFIITGRAHTTEHNFVGKLFRKMMVKYLEDNNIPYDQIIYCDEKTSADDKLNVCTQLNIDIMFEDKYENIDAIKDITKVVCFNTKNNSNYNSNSIVKVSNFDEAYEATERIKKIIKTKEFSILTLEERKKLSRKELLNYYENLKKHYQNLPYDDKTMGKLEKNYSLAVKLGIPVFNILYKPIVINKEFIPKEDGCIFVSNHLGSLDQFPIMSAIGNRPIHFMAASTLLKLKRGFLYRHTGSIFVDRENENSRHNSKELMIKILVNGGNVFMFPEGTRNRTDKYMLEFKKGAVSIAQTTGAKIVPFAVNNNYKINGNSLIVRAGKPIEVLPTDDVSVKTDELKEIIGTMIWENMQLEQDINANNRQKKR